MEDDGFEQDEGDANVSSLRAALAQDVTHRQSVEANLRLQADLLDQVEVAVMASDANRQLTQWNRAAEKLLGISKEEALGRTVDEALRIPPESQAQRDAQVLRLGSREKWEGELTLYGPDEKTFPAYATNAPVCDPEGEIVGYAAVIVDLSEMKSTRAELQRRAEEQATIATLSRTAMSSDNVDSLLEQAAQATIEILGAERAEVYELKPDGQEMLLRASLGPEVPKEHKTTVPIEGAGQAYGVLNAYGDSDRHFSEKGIQFLQSVATVLAASIARERTQRLESQLHQNRRLEAVGQLAGGVAHDFNNLLVVILNYAEFLRTRIEDESLREDLDEIKNAAVRAAGLTHQLLVFSRREVVVPEVVDLNEVVTQTAGLLRQTVHEHIELVHSFAEGLWGVRLGSGQAEQILVNLLVNARNAMPDGGTVNVKTENLGLGHGKQELTEGKYVRLTVADTGTGMDKEVAEQAFDPFFTTRKDDGGTGLGLATVYGIVKEAGGHIEIYSEPGHGTAIKAYLPAVLDEAAEAAVDTRQAVVAAGQTILLVEDEESVRKLAGRILVEDGYEVLTAKDGQGAMELAAEHDGTIDLLLTDVVMPRLSGPQLAKDLQEIRPQMRTLFMSGYTGEVISRHGIAEEGVALIEKPFDATGLLYAVSNALHGPREPREV